MTSQTGKKSNYHPSARLSRYRIHQQTLSKLSTFPEQWDHIGYCAPVHVCLISAPFLPEFGPLACSEYFHFFSWIFPVRNLQKLYVLAGCANRHYFCRVRIMLCISPMFWIVTLCVAVCTSVWSGSNLIYENSHNKDQSECRGNLQQFQIKHFKRKSLIRLFSWCEKNQMSRQVTTIQHF